MRVLCRAVRIALSVDLIAASFSAAAGTIQVNSTAAPSAGFCTLAQAIYAANRLNNQANATPTGATTVAPLDHSVATAVGSGTCAGASAGANTIDLSTYAGQTITFSIDQPDNFWYGPNALPPIGSDITIEGHGAKLFIQNGTSPRLRFFFVGADPQATVSPGYNTPGPGKLTLRNLTLSGGRQKGGASASGAGAGMGGAIFNQGTLNLSAVTLNDNRAIGGDSSGYGFIHGGGMGADGISGGGMGGAVPSGTGDAGFAASGAAGGNGGGTNNGLGGAGGPGGLGGNGAGGGATVQNSFTREYGGGGGGGFAGGSGGAGAGYGYTYGGGGGGFGQGGGDGYCCLMGAIFGGGGGGVGGGGGAVSSGAGGGFGGGGSYGGHGGLGGGAGGFAGGSTNKGSGGGGLGGAIFNHNGLVTLFNVTMTANVAQGGYGNETFGSGGSGFGGAIFDLNGEVHVSFSTLAYNSVAGGTGSIPGISNGGAIYALGYNGAPGISNVKARVGLSNSIASNSIGGSDVVIDAPFTVANGNSNAAPSQIINFFEGLGPNIVMTIETLNAGDDLPDFLPFDPELGPLSVNQAINAPMTLAPLPGSPAIQTADCLAYDRNSNVTVDERGSPRPTEGCDMGAYDGERIMKSGFQ